MIGTIDVASPRLGKYSARMDDGSFIAFELTDSVELASGDNIIAAQGGHGSQDFRLAGNGEKFSVFVEMIGATRITAGTWAASSL